MFIIFSDEKSAYNGMISIFVKQCYEALISAAHANPSNRLDYRVNFMPDEFANMPQISDFKSMISAARSRNIRFMLVVQSGLQLLSKYGNGADMIKGNCINWIYLTGREY